MTTSQRSPAQRSPDASPNPTIPAIPPADVLGRIAALRQTPTPGLKQTWRELFGREPTIFNRPYLISRLTYRV